MRLEMYKQNMMFIKQQIKDKKRNITQEFNGTSPDVVNPYSLESTNPIAEIIEKGIISQRCQFKAQLDQQVMENRNTLMAKKTKEEQLDKQLLHQINASLEKDIKIKEEQKQKLQTQLKESWAYSAQTKKMTQEIDNLRNLRSFEAKNEYHPQNFRYFPATKKNRSLVSKSEASDRLDFLIHKEKKIKKEQKKIHNYLNSRRSSRININNSLDMKQLRQISKTPDNVFLTAKEY